MQNGCAFTGAVDLRPAPAAIGKANGRRRSWRIVTGISRVEVAGTHGGAANRNVAADGTRLSSRPAVSAAGESGSRSADRRHRPAWFSNVGVRVDFSIGGKNPRRSALSASSPALLWPLLVF